PVAVVDANGAASTEHWSRAASCWTPSATCREERDKAAPLGRNQPAVVDVAADGPLRERGLELVVALAVCSAHPLAARSSPPSVATRPPAWAPTRPPWPTAPPPGCCASGCWSWSWRWRFAANTRWPREPPRRRWRHDLRRSMCGRSSALGWPASSTQRSPGAAGAPRPAAEVQFRQQAGATVVLVKDDGHVIGALAVRGELHPEAAEVIARLRFGRLPHHHAHQRQPRYHHRCGGRRRHQRRA